MKKQLLQNSATTVEIGKYKIKSTITKGGAVRSSKRQ